jgi:hypothetical protein
MKTIFSVTQNGTPLKTSQYNWDEKSKIFSTNEKNLVLDFNVTNYVTFKTGSSCTFNTGYNCTFNTGSDCTFKTGSDCTFATGSDCTFNTSHYCTFTTGENCVIVRSDIFEIIKPSPKQKIKLNNCSLKGFTVIQDKLSLSGKEISVTIDGQTYSAIVK